MTAAAVCTALGVRQLAEISSAQAETATTTAYTGNTFAMEKGASVRVKGDAATQNGLRFTAEMSAAYYDGAMQLNDVSFGMFIMPYEYVAKYGDLTAANVGASGVYDWATSADGVTMEYGTTEKMQILNVSYRTLEKDEGKDNAYYIRGSIVNIKETNLEKEFIGRAYVRYKVGDAYEYDMADWTNDRSVENARSIYYVASKALDDASSGLTETQNSFLTTNYIEKTNAQYEEISSLSEFLAMSATGKYKLVSDIDFSEYRNENAAYGNWITAKGGEGLIPEFSGVLDGNGHSIKNVTLATQTDQALFGTLTGTIKNVKFENVEIKGYTHKESATGRYSVRSALIYKMKYNATVKNVVADVTISCNGASYTESTNWAAAEQNAGLVACFIGGKITDVEMTFDSPTNDSLADGSVAISSVSWKEAGCEVQNPTLENVTVYAKSDKVRLYRAMGDGYGNPQNITNCRVIVEEENIGGVTVTGKPLWSDKKSWYAVAKNPFGLSGTESTETIDGESYTVTTATTSWASEGTYGSHPFISMAVSQYTELKFWIKNNGSGYIEIYDFAKEKTYISSNSVAAWTEIKMTKASDGTWTISVGGEVKQSGVTLTNLHDDFKTSLGDNTIYVTELLTYGEKAYEPKAETVTVAKNPFGLSGTETTETIDGESYTVTTASTTWGWDKHFVSVDVSAYSVLKFWIKKSGNGWIEIKDSTQTTSYISEGTSGGWMEIKMTKSGDTWTISQDDTIKATGVTLTNLYNNFAISLGDNTIFVTELIGTKENDYTVTENPFQQAASMTSADLPDESAEKITVVNTSWGWNKHFASADVSAYSELKFWIKKSGGGWIEIKDSTQTTSYISEGTSGVWMEIKMTKSGDTWTISQDNTVKATGVTLTNLYDNFAISLGDNTVYVTELQADGTSIADNPFGWTDGTVYSFEDKLDTLTNMLSTNWNTNGQPFKSVDVSVYKTLQFFIKSTGYVEFYSADGATTYFEGNLPAWTEIRFERDGDTWTLYVGNEEKGKIGLLDLATDFKVQLGTNTVYTSALFCEYAGLENYEVLAENPFNGVSGTTSSETANEISEQSTIIAATHGGTSGYKFAKVDNLSWYKELKFFVKSTEYFEIYGGSDKTNCYYGEVTTSWTEVKLLKHGETWTLFIDGTAKAYDIALTNLQDDFTLELGNNTVTVSELFGVIKEGTYSPYITAAENPLGVVGTVTTEDLANERFNDTTTSYTGEWKQQPLACLYLAPYDEILFYAKGTTDKYLEVWDADSIDGNAVWSCSDDVWHTFHAKRENGTTWQLYIDGKWINVSTTGEYLSDLAVIRMGSGGTFYFSDVLAVANTTYRNPYVTVADAPYALSGGTASDDIADGNVSAKTTKFTTTWAQWHYLTAVDVETYSELKFFIKQTGSGYIQLGLDNTEANSFIWTNALTSWTEVRFVKGESDWAVFVAGVNKGTVALTNLKDDFGICQLGTNTIYVSELLGIEDASVAAVAKNGESAYTVIYADDETNNVKEAAKELQTFLEITTGATVNVKTDVTASEIKPTDKYIVLGTLAAEKLGENAYDGLTTDTGYRLTQDGKVVYLYGKTSFGTWQAVYGFLKQYTGLEFYTKDVYAYTEGDIVCKGLNETHNPDIDYQWSLDSGLQGDAIACARLGFEIDSAVSSVGWHNALKLVSEEKYGATHADWFITCTDTNNNGTFTTLNLSNETARGEMAVAAARELAKRIESDTSDVKFYGISMPDHRGAIENWNNYYTKFVNAVTEILDTRYSFDREIKIVLLAYGDTLNAPTDGTTLYQGERVKIDVMFAASRMNMYQPLDSTADNYAAAGRETNATYMEEFAKWKALGCEVYFWKYSSYTDNYFVPLDTITNMQSVYQALNTNNVFVVYDMGQYDNATATDWSALKVYLKAKLGDDVNADVSSLISAFCTNVYGDGAEDMLALITAEMNWSPTLWERSDKADAEMGVMGGAGLLIKASDGDYPEIYWDDEKSGTIVKKYTNDMLTTWYQNVENALSKVTDETIRKRIMVEGLTIRYLSLKVFGEGLTVTTTSDTSVTDSFTQLYTDANSLGVTRFAEANELDASDFS